MGAELPTNRMMVRTFVVVVIDVVGWSWMMILLLLVLLLEKTHDRTSRLSLPLNQILVV